MKIRPLPLVIGATAVVAALALGGCAAWRISEGRDLARAGVPFEAHPSNPAARLLVVGDSTAVGTGATSPATSVPGRLGAQFPNADIVNLGRNGALYSEVPRQLGEAPAGRYDAVLILAGGNDVIRLTSESDLRAGIEAAVAKARQLAPVVVLMPSGNVGNAPFFFPPVSWYMSARSRTLHALIRAAAVKSGAAYVNLYQPRETDPFAQEPERMNAADGLHPSDDGYALWDRELLRQSPLAAALNAA